MKLFIFLFLFFWLTLPSSAQTATPRPTNNTATVSAEKPQPNNRVDDLKERLATRVAQLRQTTPQAIFGAVTQVSISSITVEGQAKATKIELTDDISVVQFLRGKRTTLTTEDIDKNDMVTVFGDYDSTIDMLKASTIFIEANTKPIRIHGTITEVNKNRNTITVQGLDEQSYTIDVETTTRTNTWSAEKGIERSGFSRLSQGMFVSILGLPDKTNETLVTASRILYLTLPGSATPTTTLSPTKLASPSATIRVLPTQRTSPTPTE